MEACIFRRHLEILEEIDEETSYLEIANYTVILPEQALRR